MPQWFDAGVNLFSERFEQDRDSVVHQARAHQVDHLLLISSDVAESHLNIHYSQTSSGIYCTAGVHPHQASAVAPDWLAQLGSLLQQPKVVAVGECGLDFNRNFSAPEQQIQVFAAQLQLAKDYKKPLYLHERDAFETQIALLKQYPDLSAVAHCFTGDKTQLKAYLDLGLYIGITGWVCDDKRGTELMEAVRYLPLDRLILETDAPYLLPKTAENKPKSRRNEPAFLPWIGRQLSLLTGQSVEEIASQSRQNCLDLFKIPTNEYPL